MTSDVYEVPEVVELGDADEVIQGCSGASTDKCHCAKCTDVEF